MRPPRIVCGQFDARVARLARYAISIAAVLAGAAFTAPAVPAAAASPPPTTQAGRAPRATLQPRDGTTLAGYRLVASDGGIFTEGDATYDGSEGGKPLNQPIVGMADTPDDGGYWLVASDGGIFTFGDAQYDGSQGGTKLNKPIVGMSITSPELTDPSLSMAATPDGKGYWLVSENGTVSAFGDAVNYGSKTGSASPINGIAAAPGGTGYWLLGANGAVYGFGSVPYDAGSLPAAGISANDAMAIAPTPDGKGYWIVEADGMVWPFGDAVNYGSAVAVQTNWVITDIVATPDGKGYWLLGADGSIYNYGDAGNYGGSS